MKSSIPRITVCQLLLPLALLAVVSAPRAHAATRTWDNDSADGQWKTVANWSGDTLPVANDTVIINNGDTVNWNGGTGQFLPANLNITLDGNSTWTAQTVIRLNNATVTVNSGSTLTSTAGAFWDLDDADITFENGAIVTIDDWENKDVNTFTFNLGSSGFSTLTPNNFFIGTGSLPGNIANATYNVDMASYTGGNNVITLVDYVSDFAGMNDATFQGAGGLNVLNPGANSGAIYWDNVAEAIRLNVNQTKVWEGDVNNTWTQTGNWIGAPDQSAPISGVDNVLFDTAVSTANNLVINTPFTIADGRSMEAIGSSGTHVVRLASTLTVETGGTLDFSTGGNHVFAESGAATARLTIEPDATVDFWRLFSGDGWTFEFIAGANGVTTVDIADGFWLRGGSDLEVDISLLSGYQTETLFNYGFLTDAGTFDIVTITDASLGTLTLSAFDPLGDPTQLDFGTYWIDYTTGSSITLFYNTFVFPTPEPSTMFPLGVGLPRLIGARPRR